MFNPSLNATNKGSAHKKAVAEVTKWVTDAISTSDVFHGEQFQVMVTEILCNEPNCAPIETLVIVMLMDLGVDVPLNSKNSQKWANKILKPVAEVSRSDVDDLMQEIFLSEADSVSATAEYQQNLELFEVELVALVNKYSSSDPSTVLLDSQKLIDILQNQMNTLNQKRIPVERIPTVSIPVEPVRTVTTVTMKPNAVKPTATPIIQSLDSAPSAPAAVTKVNMASIAMHSANVSEDTSSVLSTSVTTNAMEVVSESETTPVNIPVAAPNAPKPVVSFTPPDLSGAAATIVPRHKKGGTRPRGCPCCDPDNLDNIIDSMLFSHYPQT